MLKLASHYRIDWRREFEALAPYLKGKGGIVGIEYDSDEAASDKFNYLLKENFGRPGNHMWSSLRVDHDWFTTHKAAGILDEMNRLLTDAGFPAERTQEEHYALNLFSGNDLEQGDLTSNWTNVTLHVGGLLAGAALRARVRAVSEAMCRYIACGGHFMIVVNDAPVSHQSEFWRDIWLGGLAEACGEKLLLVIHAGPRAGRRYHDDSPQLDERVFLPNSFEAEDSRQDDAYDDLFDVFKAEGFENPGESATLHLTGTMSSVRQLHVKLSAAIMNRNKNRWNGERKA
jgi:hypothetical protein